MNDFTNNFRVEKAKNGFILILGQGIQQNYVFKTLKELCTWLELNLF